MSRRPAVTIAVLGATGALGRRVAAELTRAAEVGRVLVCGRDSAALHEVVELLGGAAGKARRAPAGDHDSLRRVIGGADAVASCAGPATETEDALLGAALDEGVPYVSLCDDVSVTRRALARGSDARATVILGCGLRPGLSNLLFELAARRMDTVDAGAIAFAGSVLSDDGPASELHLLGALQEDAVVVSEGQFETSPGGPAAELVYFPEPLGWVETFRCAHPEVITLPSAHPEMQTLEWRFGLAERPAMDALRASAALGFAGSPAKRRAWLRLAPPIRSLIERLAPDRGGWSGVRVDVWGSAEGKTKEVSMAVVDQLPNLVAIPLATAAIALATKRVERPGVWAPESVLEPGPFLAAVGRRGVRVAELEPAAV